MFLCCVEKEKNIKHLAWKNFLRNLGVRGDPSDESPVSTWTFHGLSKAEWTVKPWDDFSHLLQFSDLSGMPTSCPYWAPDLDFEISSDSQSLREKK